MDWKPIEIDGLDTGYKVSRDGRVLNKSGKKELSQHQNQCGYMRCRIYHQKKYIFCSVHILVAKAFISNLENLEQVNHIDGNKTNNNSDNLEWVSRNYNVTHAHRNPNRKSTKGIIYYSDDDYSTALKHAKVIPGFDGYMACPDGRICSKIFKRFLRPHDNGYLNVVLCQNGKRHTMNVHRLIAITFLPKKIGCDIVNHKNGNKKDNTVENLEWVTLSTNVQHSFDKKFNPSTRSVSQYNLDGKFIASFPSLREAQRSMRKSPDSTAILYACQGKSKTAYGYKWKYEV